ncbi:extracellular solute-binding protein [Actinokineospora globicatena]|uniref:extracellular solute-binding protein n=1 Tax=Actinokineospora globicatena TaxID=103729 RepID=UPI0020A43676|nr:extracellular solute-binding protein [Actinokineospora globicatena]MCP2306465.1 carbohydrate ABC transporter substrate-binding protein, CUT1 family [Actinokineospora globicatena]GLW81894.1 ABC transporter substrate-binding protein [Actinokineospora globicatena]GLW88688.1 ABC transporter substrate-binding protein [Actinokineospora globicatena]
MRKWLAGVAVVALAAGCAPVQSGPATSGTDETTGQLRVWLFDEVNRTAKEKVVQEAVAEFQGKHAGVTVDVQYIQVQSRAERFKAAFSDPGSAPDVAEFGNTDLAGYVAAGGFADLTADVAAWDEGKDLVPGVLDTAKVGGKVHGVPWYVGVRALYYRTDVFTELGVQPPSTLDEIAPLARRIRAAKPELLGISVGGKYVYGALPFVWANGGDIATKSGDKYTAAIDSPQAKAGIAKYAELLRDDICPPAQCAGNGGDASVENFRGGKAAMTIGGDFNRKSVDASAAAGKYGVVPLPGKDPGSVAPAFSGGNLLGVLSGTKRRTLAGDFVELLAGKRYQRKMYDAMGNLPTFTDVQRVVADADPFLKPFTTTLAAGTRFVPVTPSWAKIDAQAVLPTMLQEIATGGKDVDTAATSAADAMNAAFTS